MKSTLISGLTFLALTFLLFKTDAYRYLVVFPMPPKSHYNLGVGVVNHLLDAGHEVVFVTGFPKDKPRSNLTEVDISALTQQLLESTSKMTLLKDLVGIRENFADSPKFLMWCSMVSRLLLENEVFNNFLRDPKQKFDAVIVEWFFSDLQAGLAPLFECPLIWIGSTEAHWQTLRLIDEVTNPAHSIDIFSYNELPLTFTERVEELWTMMKRLYTIQFTIVPMERAAYSELLEPIAAKRGVKMSSYDEAVFNASLLLVNSHVSMGTPYKLPQNGKQIGGYHLSNKVKALPQNLKLLMDGAKHGVIYFSMGSNLKSKDMTDEMKKSLLEMFGKLQQTVIWKFEEKMRKVPKNVHLMAWAPQQSILAHPNLKFFITHGGQLSITEAVHFGVPIIGIPVFGDQFINMQMAVNKGFGVMVGLTDNLADQLTAAIKKVLSDPRYKKNAEQMSLIYHDRPVPPGKELVHWVEHVVKTGGAPHLRSPAFMVPWYQKMYLDLAAVVFLFLITLKILFMFLRNTCSLKKRQKLKGY